MTTLVFEGYVGLFTKFWGFDEDDCMDFHDCTFEQLEARIGDFSKQPVVMVDEVEYGHVIMHGYSGKDLTLNTCFGVRCLDLTSESFHSRLFLQADLETLFAASHGTIAISDFLQPV